MKMIPALASRVGSSSKIRCGQRAKSIELEHKAVKSVVKSSSPLEGCRFDGRLRCGDSIYEHASDASGIL